MRLSLAVLIIGICILSPIPLSAQTKVSGDGAKTKAVVGAHASFIELPKAALACPAGGAL